MYTLNKNIFFILVIFLIFVVIVLLNYIVDPHDVFRNRQEFNLFPLTGDMINIHMKINSDLPMETVLVGTSDINSAFKSTQIYKLTLRGARYKQYYELLKAHLDLHSETKNIVVVLTYSDITGMLEIEIPQYTGATLNMRELIFLLFSCRTTIDSFFKIKNKYFKKEIYERQENRTYACFPKQFDIPIKSFQTLEKEKKENYLYIKKIIKLVEKHKLNCVFVIPPYNASYLSFIRNIEHYNDRVINLKRFLIENNVNIYDFGFINLYTEKSLFDFPYFYYNSSHPSTILGNKMLSTLFPDNRSDNKEKLPYLLLSKDNIDSVIEYEDILIRNWERKNPKIVKMYTTVLNDLKKEDFLYSIIYTSRNIPQEYINDFEWIWE